ncbi:MAG: ABC transporter ATP-binding protein [Methanosarcinales archaeon]
MNLKSIIDDQSRKNLRNFFKILYKYKKEWIITTILLFIVTLMKLPMPLLTGYIIDNVIIKNNSVLLNYLCGGLIVITIVYLVIGYLKDYVLFCAQTAITIRIRLKLFERIQNFPLSEISDKETGYLLARILNDPPSLNGLFFQTFLTLAQSVITLIVGVTVIFTINWRLSLLSLFILPFFVHSNLLFIEKIKYWNNQIKEKKAVISKELSESLTALKITKLFSLYKYETIKFLKNMKDEFKFSKKQFNFDYAVSLASGFFAAMGPLVVVWYGGHEVIHGNLSIGQLVAFSSLLGFLYNPTKAMLNINVNFQKSLVSLNRIFEILNMPTEKKLIQPGLKKFSPKNFQIEFRDVSFSYNGSAKVLNNINLKIKDNERVAIIGPTGAGKSTLVNLLAFFYEPNQGSIFIRDRNIKDIPLNQLRKYIGFVSQEDFLFSTTIYNNIKIGNLKASHNDITKAAKLANAYQFIQSLPNGFDTVVGEEGEYLSGGQRQLICIARVILKNPSILILDEPTSAIDSKTEKLILESLQSFINGRVTILISHRLSTILKVDRIVILENGRISDVCTHEELLNINEFYYEIFTNQVKSLTKKQNRLEIT